MIKNPTMTRLTNELLAGVLSDPKPPCLSLYQPTNRRYPENQQDPIRFRNLVKELAASLRQDYPNADARLWLEPFEALARDTEFWNHTLDGLAVLGGPGFFRTMRIPQPVTELVVAADSFHTKPLRRFLQSVDRYQVLGLSLDKIRLFEGNRHALEELDLAPEVPRTIADALGGELTNAHQTVASYGGVGGTSTAMHHGSGAKADEADSDADRFFRAVDRSILEHYSKPSGLPLILAALPEHHNLFHQVSQNPHLAVEGVSLNPHAMPADELRALAWQVVEPQYHARLASLVDEFEQARSKSLGSDDVAQVAEAAAGGQVATLLIDADHQLAGRIDGATGRVDFDSLGDPHVDDLLDDLGELVTKKGGTVLVIPAERMPSQTGVAAIYRY